MCGQGLQTKREVNGSKKHKRKRGSSADASKKGKGSDTCKSFGDDRVVVMLSYNQTKALQKILGVAGFVNCWMD